jgi:hypothetical protein
VAVVGRLVPKKKERNSCIQRETIYKTLHKHRTHKMESKIYKARKIYKKDTFKKHETIN